MQRRDPGCRHRTTLPALHLAEPTNQVNARALRALVKVGGPVRGLLAARADQHKAVGTDAAAPGTGTPLRIGLPSATPITGHMPFRLSRSCVCCVCRLTHKPC